MAASAILFFHVFSGAVGLLSGVISMITRKGSKLHRRSGNLFFISMACMSIGGMLTGHIRGNIAGVLVASLALYSVATAKLTLERNENEIGRSEYVALFYILVAIVTIFVMALGLEREVIVVKDATPTGNYIFTVIALIFASGDIRLILRRGISGVQRIARHIWRMCFTFFFSALSFFLGQPQVFPEWILSTPLLYLPEVLIIFLTIFWLYKVLSSKSGWQLSTN